MIIRYAEEKNFIELRQFYDGMCKVLSQRCNQREKSVYRY